MWRKLVQSTYRRNSWRPPDDEPYLPRRFDRAVFFIGAYANLWTGIEDHLDVWVEEIHERGGDNLIQSQLPPNLDRELDYLSEAIKIGLVPKSDRDEAAALIQRLHQIKGLRHTVIHGSLIDVQEGMRVVLEHARVRGAKRVRARVTLAHAQMIRHYNKAYSLLRDLSLFLTGKDATKGES